MITDKTTPVTLAGRMLIRLWYESSEDEPMMASGEFEDAILAIEAEAISRWLQSPEAERALLWAMAYLRRTPPSSCTVLHFDADGFPTGCPDGPRNEVAVLLSALRKKLDAHLAEGQG